jgi:cold-inducible RNA-binding protein
MGNRLYIGNLSYHTTTEELRAEFSKCGTVVDAKVVTNQETGQNRGFGFVEFATEAEANGAIQTLDGHEFDGRQLRVRVAEPKPSRGSGGPRNFDGPSQGTRSGGGQGRGFGGGPPEVYSQDSSNKGGGKRRGGGGRRRNNDDIDWG